MAKSLFLILALISVNQTFADSHSIQTADKQTLRLAVTSSLHASGIINALLDDFSRRNPTIKIVLSRAGALEVLKFAREGKADVVISHHPPGEKRFIAQGYGRDRTQFIYSEFVLFGPAGEIPEITQATDIITALKILAEEEVEFLVPSARSGVFAVIEELWVTAGIEPTWIGYENTGISGASNLRQAADVGAYTIMDFAAYLVNRNKYKDKIVPLIRGDIALRNIYSVTIVKADKVKGAREELAQVFYDYLIGEHGQDIIARYGEETLNASFLTPAANFDTALREKRAKENTQLYKQQSERMRAFFLLACVFFFITIILMFAIRRAEIKRYASEAFARECSIERDSSRLANEFKSKFLANMSHELRTPLTAIIGYSELLEEEANDQGKIGAVNDLQHISKAAYHLLKLINDILDLSKIEAGKIELCPRIINLPSLVQEVRSTIMPIVTENSNDLIIEVSTDIKECFVDDTKLKQILINLMSNACKFSQNGQVSLNVKNNIDQSISFVIRDTGIGLTKEQQGRIFDSFSQADKSTTRKFGGTGLGLAICKHYCHLMGGSIRVESEIGKGATFTVMLPNRIEAA